MIIHLVFQSFFQAVKKPVISNHRNHRSKRHNLNKQFRFHTLVIVDETFIGVFIYSGGVFFIVGKKYLILQCMYKKAVFYTERPVFGIQMFQKIVGSHSKAACHLVEGKCIQYVFI